MLTKSILINVLKIQITSHNVSNSYKPISPPPPPHLELSPFCPVLQVLFVLPLASAIESAPRLGKMFVVRRLDDRDFPKHIWSNLRVFGQFRGSLGGNNRMLEIVVGD